MVYRNGCPLRHYERWYFNDTRLEVVSNYKYLGVYFTPPNCIGPLREQLCLNKHLQLCSAYLNNNDFGTFRPKDAFKLFDMIVRPIMCYGAEIAASEKVHTDFCRRSCGLNKKSRHFFTLCECNRALMSVHYMTKCVGYWTKVLKMPNERYPRQCYLMLRRLDEASRKTWATYVKDILYEHGFGHAWLAQDVGSRSDFMKLLIDRVNDGATLSMFSQWENSPKADHYKHCKTQLDVERYFCINLPFKFRVTI